MDYLENLNDEQKKAVLETEGPVLIVAGAGAGKTKTMTHRIIHLIEKGVNPENILAITFTNKAAREMKERVENLLNKKGVTKNPFISTFHSLGVKIIKDNAELLGIPRYFTIYDKTDSRKAIKEAMEYFGIEIKDNIEKIQNIISKEKSGGFSVKEYLERGPYDFISEATKKVWPKYEEILKRDGALDFDDLLLKSLKLLEKENIRKIYQNIFIYIHVDEYQDTNKVQNEIINLLSEKNKNVCVVGDTDQNIYGWRGAEIKNMLGFEKKYPEVKVFFLERNYRSTKNIIGAANEIISKNSYRIPKNLYTENEDGEKINIFTGINEADEAYFIASQSKELIEKGINPENIAVLYRANFQSRILEEFFISMEVPYELLGTKFFERKEVKDILSYIRASLNEKSIGDFSRAISSPSRGIGKVTIQKIIDGQEANLSPSVKTKIQSFKNLLENFKEVIKNNKPSESVKYIIEKSGLIEMYEKDKTKDDENRIENMMELSSIAVKYDDLSPEEGMEKFITDVSLWADQDSMNEKIKGVKLMTVHASKGLEFDYVFISGLEEDLFPHKGFGEKHKNKEEKEEERRLFYVAMTRAKKKLFLTHTNTRTIFGSTQINCPSIFLSDIPEKYTENEKVAISKEPIFSIKF